MANSALKKTRSFFDKLTWNLQPNASLWRKPNLRIIAFVNRTLFKMLFTNFDLESGCQVLPLSEFQHKSARDLIEPSLNFREGYEKFEMLKTQSFFSSSI